MSESSRRAPAGRVAFVHPPADAGAVGMMAMAARLHVFFLNFNKIVKRVETLWREKILDKGHRQKAASSSAGNRAQARCTCEAPSAAVEMLTGPKSCCSLAGRAWCPAGDSRAAGELCAPSRPVEALDGLVQLGQGEEVVDRVGSTGEAQGTQSVPRMFAYAVLLFFV